jgi:NAD(P)-dependent dehydrogenase (short-subunit alcohol dehydrogenase family)
MNLKGKVIVVTGSSSGIGKEVVMALAEKGAKLVITYNKNKKGGKEVFDICSKTTKCLLVKLDTANVKSVIEAVKKITKKFRRINILMNNAAVIYRKSFSKQSIGEIEQQITTNLLGNMIMTKIALPHLNKKEALIINMGSLRSRYPSKNVVSYCASKFGIHGFTQALALELPKNIKICLFNPNPTATRMTNFNGDDPKKVAELIVKVMEGKIKVKKGGDIDAKNYMRK